MNQCSSGSFNKNGSHQLRPQPRLPLAGIDTNNNKFLVLYFMLNHPFRANWRSQALTATEHGRSFKLHQPTPSVQLHLISISPETTVRQPVCRGKTHTRLCHPRFGRCSLPPPVGSSSRRRRTTVTSAQRAGLARGAARHVSGARIL